MTDWIGRLWRGEAKVAALRALLIRFLGRHRADAVFAADFRRRGEVLSPDQPADAALVQLAERQLARAIGAASARVIVGSVMPLLGSDGFARLCRARLASASRIRQCDGDTFSED